MLQYHLRANHILITACTIAAKGGSTSMKKVDNDEHSKVLVKKGCGRGCLCGSDKALMLFSFDLSPND